MIGYDPASGVCAGRSQPGALALQAWILAEYTTASSLGIYNCRPVRGAENDPTPQKSVHADGRAGDTAFPLDNGHANPLGHDLAARLVAAASQLGIQTVIFDNAIWTSKVWRWKKHCGHAGARGPHGRCSGPHYDHVHWEITWAAARGDTALTRPSVDRILGSPTSQEDDMPQPTTIVDALETPDGKGVWLLQYDGGVITKDDAPFYGAYPGLPPAARQGVRHFVRILPYQGGYLLVADDGARYRFPPKKAV